MIERKVESAARQTLGGVPSSWNIKRVAERLERLTPLSQHSAENSAEGISKAARLNVPSGLIPPPITYCYWLQRTRGLNALYYVGSVLSEENIRAFENDYAAMANEASLMAELDVDNFVAESKILDVPTIIQHSVLSISDLYKYIAAQEHSLAFLLSSEQIGKAKKALQTNPYLFFSYGDDAELLMPVKWEDL